MNDNDFYLQCAIAAMQGLQESGFKYFGTALDLMPKELASKSFDIADAMLNEYHNRKHINR